MGRFILPSLNVAPAGCKARNTLCNLTNGGCLPPVRQGLVGDDETNALLTATLPAVTLRGSPFHLITEKALRRSESAFIRQLEKGVIGEAVLAQAKVVGKFAQSLKSNAKAVKRAYIAVLRVRASNPRLFRVCTLAQEQLQVARFDAQAVVRAAGLAAVTHPSNAQRFPFCKRGWTLRARWKRR